MNAGILVDRDVLRLMQDGMITPYLSTLVRKDCISYGLSSIGYDIRLSSDPLIEVLGNLKDTIDPKGANDSYAKFSEGGRTLISEHSWVLGRSVEYFRMPSEVFGLCVGKSTYARCGIIVNITPLEPGWEGHLTIEIVNPGPRPVWIYHNEGIAQIVFFRSETPPTTTYADRKGKYQGQVGVTLPRV